MAEIRTIMHVEAVLTSRKEYSWEMLDKIILLLLAVAITLVAFKL